jgi:transcriptional regulator with XRE-family HTH domain
MEDIRATFGKAGRRRRNKLGVSQEAFADLCELDRTYIGGIERGERNVALVNIEKIARALKISLSELFRSMSRDITALTYECYLIIFMCTASD